MSRDGTDFLADEIEHALAFAPFQMLTEQPVEDDLGINEGLKC